MNNIIDNDTCNCGQIETAFHYFIECPQYTILRNDLDLETGFVPILTLNIILNGDSLNKEMLHFILLCLNISWKLIVFNLITDKYLTCTFTY